MANTDLKTALKDRLRELDAERRSIERFLGSLIKKAGKAARKQVRANRKLSAKGLAAIRRAQKARWRKVKAAATKG